jgi:hypothetical protein
MEVRLDIQPEPLVETTMTDRENSPAYAALPGVPASVRGDRS